MTKVMKLRITYDGFYGGSMDETLVLPMIINGVVFDRLEEGDHNQEVFLGEVAGKHSQEYGDLEVSFMDLDELSIKEVTDLINQSNFNEFESFFEGLGDRYTSEEEDKAIQEICDFYGVVEDSYLSEKTHLIYNKFIDSLQGTYVRDFKTVTVLEEDYNESTELLAKHNITCFK